MSRTRQLSKQSLTIAVAIAALAASIIYSSATRAEANHEPADKVSASGSTTEIGGPGERVLLMSETVRTANPTDLLLSVSLECSIITEVTTIGNDTSKARGHVEVWIEIDGQAVPVSTEDADDGHVVFCNRTYERETTLFDDEDATIRTFMETRHANAFNWMALDVGSAVHTIEVYARLTQEGTDSDQTAEMVVGDRTLIVEPTKSANDEEVTELG